MKWLNYTSVIKLKTNKPPKSQNKKTNKQTKQNKNPLFSSLVNLNCSWTKTKFVVFYWNPLFSDIKEPWRLQLTAQRFVWTLAKRVKKCTRTILNFCLFAIVSRGVGLFANPGENICGGYQVKENKEEPPVITNPPVMSHLSYYAKIFIG